MAKETLQVWEQRDNESQEAFEAFEAYRTLGHIRSIAKAAASLGKSAVLLHGWSSPRNHEWQKRILAWDRHEARHINDQILAGTAAMRERIAMQGMNMQMRAAKAVQDMTPDQLKKMSPTQIVALFRAGAEMELKARSIPESEQDRAERDDAPSFQIHFVAPKPDEMVSVRLQDGQAGYIPASRVDEFLAAYEGAVAIR